MQKQNRRAIRSTILLIGHTENTRFHPLQHDGSFLTAPDASRSLSLGNPLGDLGHHLWLDAIETVISHRFAGIPLALPAVKRE